MKHQNCIILEVITVFLISTLALTNVGSVYVKAQGQNLSMPTEESYGNVSSSEEGEVYVRDSQAVLLEGMTIPSQGFIHLYDSTPFVITNGHIGSKYTM